MATALRMVGGALGRCRHVTLGLIDEVVHEYSGDQNVNLFLRLTVHESARAVNYVMPYSINLHSAEFAN